VRRLISQDLNAVEASAEPGDLDLTAASLSALGQIVERQGIDKDTATLVVGSFKKPRVGPEKAVRELKRAALTVIDTEAKGADVQAMLLALYKDVLAAPGDKDLRIPAILALGSLARQKNEEALALLGDCLERQEQFEPQETMAAMDAVAYVGGEYALGRFLPRVVSTKDPALQAHTLKRVTGIVAEGGPELLLSTLVEVERLAMDQDSQAYLEFAVGLTVDPQLKEALSAAKLETGNDRQTELLLRLFLVQARVFDALGRDEETTQALAAVGDTLAKDLTIREKHPALVQEAAALKAQMALRTPLKTGFVQSEGAEPAAVIQSLLPLFAPDLGAATRWRNLRWVYRQIAQAPVTDRSDRIREAWQKYLASDEGKPLWTGIAPSCRDRALSRLEALKARPKSTEPPGK
jgi:hypothetical protein